MKASARPSGSPEFVPFVKMQAAGNAFVLVDALSGPVLDWPQLSVATADPHFAVGHDGLLVVLPSETADYRQRMFNPDGTEDMCGNGLRCVAKYLHDTGRIGSAVILETIAGPRSVELLRTSGATAYLRAELGVPDVRDVPLTLDALPPAARAGVPRDVLDALQTALAAAVYVSFGTPHVVLRTESALPDGAWETVSRALERSALSDEPTNVTWFRGTGAGRIEARFWERSIGETLACGTGTAGAMVAARRAGLADEELAIGTKGGELRATWNAEGAVHVEGPATTVFRGQWRLSQ